MYIYLLFFIFLIFVFFSFIFFKKDYLEPGIVIPLTFCFSSFCALYSIDIWNVDICFESFFLLISGIAVFILVSFVTRQYLNKRKQYVSYKIFYISYSRINLFIFNFFVIFISVIYVHFIVKIALQNGASGGWSELMNSYRLSNSHSVSQEAKIPSIISYLYRFAIIGSYLPMYILINNFISTKKLDIFLLSTVVISMVASILSGGRTDLVRYLCSAIVIFSVLNHRLCGWKFKITCVFVIKLLFLIIVLLYSFYLLKGAVGRLNDTDIIYYISYYVGGSVELFDLFIKDPLAPSPVFGKETFYGIYSFIGPILGDNDLIYTIHKEFRSSNGILIGNVYSMFRSYIYDFGLIGFYLLTSIFAFFSTYIYQKVKQRKIIGFDFLLLFYSYIFHTICMSFFSEQFFVTLISFTMIKNIIFFITAYLFFIRLKLRMGYSY